MVLVPRPPRLPDTETTKDLVGPPQSVDKSDVPRGTECDRERRDETDSLHPRPSTSLDPRVAYTILRLQTCSPLRHEPCRRSRPSLPRQTGPNRFEGVLPSGRDPRPRRDLVGTVIRRKRREESNFERLDHGQDGRVGLRG